MVTEDYVSFETAKLLKEKGFDWETRGYYPIKGDATGRLFANSSSEYNHNHSQVQISAPTLQMATKWLREVHNLHIEVFITTNKPRFQWKIYRIDDDSLYFSGGSDLYYEKYEQACEAAIKYCLENLI